MKIKTNIVTLDKNKKREAYMSRAEYFEKYSVLDANGYFKSIIKGAPILLTIDGSTYLVDKLPVIGNKLAFDNFYRELRSPTAIDSFGRVIFVWK